MNNEEYINSTYLALELTKVYTNHIDKYTKESIYDVFAYYLEQINDTILTPSESVELDSLKRENERLKNLHIMLKHNGITNIVRDDIVEYLNSVKGDMEPYVFNTLINKLK